MADALGHRVIKVDLTSGTKRLLRADLTEICSVVLDGIGPAVGAGSILQLKEDGTGGDPVWQYSSTGATQQHVNDYTETKASKGLYIATNSDADFAVWGAGAVLLIYTK